MYNETWCLVNITVMRKKTMNNNIQVSYDEIVKGYIIKMPELVSLNAIEEWKKEFSVDLNSLPLSQRFVMLIDTNKHEFESIQCLKSLRDFFTTNADVQSKCVKVAFVQPKEYIEPCIKSEIEGYFGNYEEAYKWLENYAY